MNKALNIAYETKRQARADGGGVFEGPIISDVPGRTDKHPMDVGSSSYVLPSETISHLGENNTLAGLQKVKQMGPAGLKKLVRSCDGSSNLIKKHQLRRALGGASNSDVGQPTPVVTAGGEFVIPPDWVREIGDGDVTLAHRLLDNFVMKNRKKHIETLRKLSPPAKD